MITRSMLPDAFRPNTGWNAGIRSCPPRRRGRVAPGDRWKVRLRRIAAALLVAALLLALGVRNPQLR